MQHEASKQKRKSEEFQANQIKLDIEVQKIFEEAQKEKEKEEKEKESYQKN